MNRELIDHIGFLLFGNEGNPKVLQLKSEKQFHVRQDGTLEKEQSVLTDIVVGTDAIYLTYQLPDGHTVCYRNAVTDVECEVDSNYKVGCIVYRTVADHTSPKPCAERSLFTLFCDDDRLIFFGEQENDGKESIEKTFFEISAVA